MTPIQDLINTLKNIEKNDDIKYSTMLSPDIVLIEKATYLSSTLLFDFKNVKKLERFGFTVNPIELSADGDLISGSIDTNKGAVVFTLQRS